MSEAVRQHRPLTGLGVLVTRPVGQAEGLCRLVEAAGGTPVRLPLLEIIPEQPIGAQWRECLDETDWMIFVSVNAVRCGLSLLEERPPTARRPRIAAIGRATAAELVKRGVAVDLTPEQQFNSEMLLATSDLAEVAGQRFLIVRGFGGREMLAETLRARGAEVTYAEVYRRILPETDIAAVLEQWRAGDIDVVTITSGDALVNLATLLDGKGMDLLAKTPMVVISRRLEKQARELGCIRVMTAANAGDQAIVDSIISGVAPS